MAGKRRHYLLTATAGQDFREAKRWSLSRWGKELTRQYFADLRFASMEHVGDTQLSIHPVREHYLVYVPVSSKRIVIVSLIRQTRDVPAILNANGYMIRRQLKQIVRKLEKGEIPNLE